MNVNLEQVTSALKQLEEKHAQTKGTSGRSAEWEDGFLAGLNYIREFVVPAFETLEIDEATAIERQLENELEALKARHRFGLDA